MTRRQFCQNMAGAIGVGMAASSLSADAVALRPELVEPTPSHLPRWRGFNLLDKFNGAHDRPYRESDFALIAEWGFNFVRLPMSYACWTDPSDWLAIREQPMKDIDQAVEFGRQYGIHVNLNLHRAPGYCVNPPKEPLDLWTDDAALEACAFHWAHLAKRYKGIPSSRVSFDLLNEPPNIPVEQYVHVVSRLTEAIRAEDAQRLIIADGLNYGSTPVPELAVLRIGQSTRGYNPSRVSHYMASWVKDSLQWPAPTWPLQYIITGRDGTERTERWDRDRLARQQIEPWLSLQRQGVGIHVGEWGAHNRTPHQTALAWMKDYLDLWNEAQWGWALWNLHGSFGILDSGRSDVEYEPFHHQKLDRKMLELLKNG